MLIFCNFFADFKTVEKHAQKKLLIQMQSWHRCIFLVPINDSPIVESFSSIIDSPIVFLGQWFDNRWSDNPVAQ
jgi:hypothetical protein